ncbi:A/G-specific adenine glycosylase [Zooshikella marina]|uniref:A/G-specific adenine glycosylase n=1 Tax=Zooshikella ganghwensis TaxID=202772 RepID=UPI001BAF7F39|nr:A/G-specific adenine glycosylase [Zooshikella ganghwensis]MBU2708581.1 A/G-specific adenine glycosylase [Zooshikella ganghwensis]
MIRANTFNQAVLRWFDRHGRKHLPWQQKKTPYNVWVSEIMLQQTQVSTVIPYFERFMARFPNVAKLAAAETDEVLHLWTGLGYYARARNLHKAAKMICETYNGQFPASVDELSTLPGVGRSTAGAIASIAMGQRAAILDGNVKRVLARFESIEGWPGSTPIQNQLWAIAEHYTPHKRVADYTQAMMDLGAMICTRTKPKCDECPIQKHCQGYQMGDPTRFPSPKPKKTQPIKSVAMLLAVNKNGEVLLNKRPTQGIWGGLWSFPEIALTESDNNTVTRQQLTKLGNQLKLKLLKPVHWSPVKHVFSHFQLNIIPVVCQLESSQPLQVMEDNNRLWYNVYQPPSIGLAAPVKKLISKLAHQQATQYAIEL